MLQTLCIIGIKFIFQHLLQYKGQTSVTFYVEIVFWIVVHITKLSKLSHIRLFSLVKYQH